VCSKISLVTKPILKLHITPLRLLFLFGSYIHTVSVWTTTILTLVWYGRVPPKAIESAGASIYFWKSSAFERNSYH
jgi:hypothetical protein